MIRVLVCLVFLAFPVAGEPEVRKGEVLIASFEQLRQVDGLAKPVKSRGRFLLFPEHGVIWQTLEPVVSYLIVTDTAMWQSVNGRKMRKVALRRFPEVQTLQSVFRAVLMGDWRQVEDRFGAKPSFDGERWKLVLEPKAGALPVARIALTGAAFVQHIEVLRKNGGRDVIDLRGYTVRPAIDFADLERLF